MRGPAAFPSLSFAISLGSGAFVSGAFGLGGLGCILDSSAYVTGSGTSTSTSSTGGSTTSTSIGGGGSTTTTTTGGGGTTSSAGGGGTGGTTTTTTGGGGTGGSVVTPLSCKEALDNGMDDSGLVLIDPDGPEGDTAFEVYCDQTTDGGGWALLYNSVGAAGGNTPMFWQIEFKDRLAIKGAPASLATNFYAGVLYKWGKEFRDDVEDTAGHVAPNLMRAKANGLNDATMKLLQATEVPGVSLSSDIFGQHFAGAWASSDLMGDPAVFSCVTAFLNVTQHYGSCWRYNLGADTPDNDPNPVVDIADGGWGPHLSNSIIDAINPKLQQLGKDLLVKEGQGYSTHSSRVKRISRFARWP